MTNTEKSRLASLKIAQALGPLLEEVVFVGGAVVSLYIDDTAAADMRPTKDVDLTFQITTNAALEDLRLQLVERGFGQSAEDDVICRFRYEKLKVDVMSTQQVGWAPTNRWFAPGYAQAFPYSLGEKTIRLMPLPYFLGAKIEAFFDRGINDKYGSHDLEDIVYLFNYTSSVAEQVLAAAEDIRNYLAEKLRIMRDDSTIFSAMSAHVYYEEGAGRMEVVMERLNAVIDGVR